MARKRELIEPHDGDRRYVRRDAQGPPRLAVRVDRLKNRQITSHLAVRRLVSEAIEVPAASNVPPERVGQAGQRAPRRLAKARHMT